MPVGHPKKTISDDQLIQIEEWGKLGLTQNQIAANLGMSAATLVNRKRECAKVAEALVRGKDRGISLVAGKLWQKIEEGNLTAIIFYLKTQAGWVDRPGDEPPIGLPKASSKRYTPKKMKEPSNDD